MAKITVIEPTAVKTSEPGKPLSGEKKRRVAGYARVSTEKDEQFTSYKAQVQYYEEFIKRRPDWKFVRVYTDEGASGTSTKYRQGFRRMVRDALAGRIDLIVTKSVSRFARNTLDSLSTIRKLRDAGCEIYFEKENIYTFDSRGELLLTIMSSLAQEESRSISRNVTWGMRRCMAKGQVTLPYSTFLGYDKGPDGTLVVNPAQAEVVKEIYRRYLAGETCYRIAKTLTQRGVPTPAGKTRWYTSVIRSILSNEKYIGDARLQKTYVEDYLTKKKRVNHGELTQYYITGHHEPIISREDFAKVQERMERDRRG